MFIVTATIPTDTNVTVDDPDNTWNMPIVDGFMGDGGLTSVRDIVGGVYNGHDDDGIALTLVVLRDGSAFIDYDMCGMMGCHAYPHNHVDDSDIMCP